MGLKRKVKPGLVISFVIVCLLLAGSAFVVTQIALGTELGRKMTAWTGKENMGIKRGLDIAGGLYVLLEAVETGEAEVDADAIERAAAVIRMRVDELGVAEPVIVTQGSKRIRIELPDIENPEEAREIIGRTARLSFIGPDAKEILTGANLVRAQAMRDPSGRDPYPFVSLEFDDEGTRKFAEATGKFLGQPIAILLDDEVISAPVVQSVITDGKARITGQFTFEEAAKLALLLRSGSLPVELRELESRLVGPTLGQETMKISIYAGAAGLAAVLLFMILFYRFAGFISGVALLFYLTLVLGALTLLPTTLTLPGIAGLILSIGMAVDANVIIFERIKDELRAGRTVRSAMEGGFRHAFRTILDSNVTTIIATVVLFALASGPVRGFAVTLFIGVICSMFTAITLTRGLMRLAYRAGLMQSGRYVGVKTA
ncbi:MAG: protein translocase subunit SecD [Firmicutes bacterium]|nr:protein translocase subunit SecD [Bacillota bacterium]HPU00850.1 protein translocase subunit SecD [Bacillota bacterium]